MAYIRYLSDDELPEEYPEPAAMAVPSDARQAVTEALGPAPIELDELVRMTAIPIRTVRVVLIELDLAGRIERHPGNLVSLVPL